MTHLLKLVRKYYPFINSLTGLPQRHCGSVSSSLLIFVRPWVRILLRLEGRIEENTQNEAQTLILGAAIPQWIHLRFPSCLSGFESQAHHLCFYQFIFELCHVEKMKINKKRPGLAHFKKDTSYDNLAIDLQLEQKMFYNIGPFVVLLLSKFITRITRAKFYKIFFLSCPFKSDAF